MRQQTLKRLLIVVMVLAVAGTAAHYLWRDRGAAPAAYTAAAAQAVPVKADAARRGDIDLSLKVIGSAQPWSTVTVQARVDGQLESLASEWGGIFHTEGRRQHDVLQHRHVHERARNLVG